MCLNNVNQQPFLDTSSIAYSDLSAGSCWPRRRTTFRGGCYMARDPLRKCQPRSTEQLLLATNSLDCKTEIPRRMQLESAVLYPVVHVKLLLTPLFSRLNVSS